VEYREDIDYYSIFDDFWATGKYREAIMIYEFIKRPFWLTEKIALYYEHNGLVDLAYDEYEHLIQAYFEMGEDLLPLPSGPIELYKLGKWFIKTDPVKARKYLMLYLQADEKNPNEVRKTIFKKEAQELLESKSFPVNR